MVHDQLPEGAHPEVDGGWPQILSGLKTLLETGERLTHAGLADVRRLTLPNVSRPAAR